MESVAGQAFAAAGLTMSDIDAVAATIKPGTNERQQISTNIKILQLILSSLFSQDYHCL